MRDQFHQAHGARRRLGVQSRETQYGGRLLEFAKFGCGFEAFQTLFLGAFWISESSFTLFGITVDPMMNFIGAIFGTIASVLLGLLGWGMSRISAGRCL